MQQGNPQNQAYVRVLGILPTSASGIGGAYYMAVLYATPCENIGRPGSGISARNTEQLDASVM
jgi:hypothetical protein